MSFKKEFIKVFKDDYIHIGKYVIRPFSLAWWLVNIGIGLLSAVGFYVFYILMWVVLGLFVN